MFDRLLLYLTVQRFFFKRYWDAVYASSSVSLPAFQAESHLITNLVVKCFSPRLFIRNVFPLFLVQFLMTFSWYLISFSKQSWRDCSADMKNFCFQPFCFTKKINVKFVLWIHLLTYYGLKLHRYIAKKALLITNYSTMRRFSYLKVNIIITFSHDWD